VRVYGDSPDSAPILRPAWRVRHSILRRAAVGRRGFNAEMRGGSVMFEAFWLFIPRLLGFLVTFPLRLFGVDFDWGIR
jgi:hypothetical protein